MKGTALPADAAELVVLSHLRWTFVWQRPQHIVSRLAAHRRTWFVEEPVPGDVDTPTLRHEDHGPVTRVWLDVPSSEQHVAFDAAVAECYVSELARLLGPSADRIVWLYTALALPHATALDPGLLVYDVMDDLAAFRYASEALRLRHRRALRDADLVFTGGRSLHAGVVRHRPERTYLFPSGVEAEHFAPARVKRGRNKPPVAGYVGVIDERVDLDLVAGLADRLPDWEIRMVGPDLKIDVATLPRRPNIVYPGAVPYEQLPEVLGGFDVALMPFALNEATRSISPTKTLEYLAAGLPVVSTRVPDVVADHGAVVELADDADGFASACRSALSARSDGRAASVERLLRAQHWDSIAGRMSELMAGAMAVKPNYGEGLA